jgi:pimeloyl-ACP methyl ester carboxylesterase
MPGAAPGAGAGHRGTERVLSGAGGAALRVCQLGQGPDVLLVPGAGGTGARWGALTRPTAGLRVLSWRYGRRCQDPGDEAGVLDALAVLDAAGVGRCLVAAGADGAATAVRLARRCPERVSGLLLAVRPVPGPGSAAQVGPGTAGGTPAPTPIGAPAIGAPATAPPTTAEAMTGVVDATRTLARTLTGALLPDPMLALLAAGTRHTVPLLAAAQRAAESLPVPGPLGGLLPRTLAGLTACGRDGLAELESMLPGRPPVVPAPDLTGLACPVTVLAVGGAGWAAVARSVAPAGAVPQARIRIVGPASGAVAEVLLAEVQSLLVRAEATDEAVHAAGHRRVPATPAHQTFTMGPLASRT